ncbi:hypothetical protein SGRIM128S_01017 [Streptomyces griseomycini]
MAPRAQRNTRARPSRKRARSLRNPTLRNRRYPHTGAAVLPARTPSEDHRSEVSVMRTDRAPSAIPTQQRSPKNSREATATPVGGQMGLTTAPSTIRFRSSPSRPAAW